MKAFQIRIKDEVHQLLKTIADMRRSSVSDVVREALEVYVICTAQALQGKRLIWEDPKTGEKIEVMIPALSLPKPADFTRKGSTEDRRRSEVEASR